MRMALNAAPTFLTDHLRILKPDKTEERNRKEYREEKEEAGKQGD